MNNKEYTKAYYQMFTEAEDNTTRNKWEKIEADEIKSSLFNAIKRFDPTVDDMFYAQDNYGNDIVMTKHIGITEISNRDMKDLLKVGIMMFYIDNDTLWAKYADKPLKKTEQEEAAKKASEHKKSKDEEAKKINPGSQPLKGPEQTTDQPPVDAQQ